MFFRPGEPEVTVQPVTDDDLPPIPGEDDHAGHYQHLVLDTHSGVLAFAANDWRNPRARLFDGELFVPWRQTSVPRHLVWIIDSGVNERPYLTAEQGTALAREVAPLAQTLLDHLMPVKDGESDWSAQAISAGMDIELACRRVPEEPRGRRVGLVDMHEAVDAVPSLVNPAWREYSDTELDQLADDLQRGISDDKHAALAHALDIDRNDLRRDRLRTIHLTGVRAWLYHHRHQQLAPLTPMDAHAWYTIRELPIGADATDEEVARAADHAQQQAQASEVYLLDIEGYLLQRRMVLRDAVRDDLTDAGRAVTLAENELKRARRQRSALLARVIAWDAPPDTDTRLAERAGITRQAINQFRGQLDTDPDTEGQEHEHA